jgi:hypothetical protein
MGGITVPGQDAPVKKSAHVEGNTQADQTGDSTEGANIGHIKEQRLSGSQCKDE